MTCLPAVKHFRPPLVRQAFQPDIFTPLGCHCFSPEGVRELRSSAPGSAGGFFGIEIQQQIETHGSTGGCGRFEFPNGLGLPSSGSPDG